MFTTNILTKVLLLTLVMIVEQQEEIESIKTITEYQLLQSYDFIVVGGGTAGCVLARRLSDISEVTVLVIEAGDKEIVVSQKPGIYSNGIKVSEMDWNYSIKKQLNSSFGYIGHKFKYESGRVLGGNSAINGMTYGRGSPFDYNVWLKSGAKGWSWKNIIPIFVKIENYITDTDLSPLKSKNSLQMISSNQDPSLLGKVFFKAAKVFKINKLNKSELVGAGYTINKLTIKKGIRYSTAKSYLSSITKTRNNIHIMTKTSVRNIVFNAAKNAIGINIIKNQDMYTVYSNKEVILTSGAINSPFLLMKSGIGPKQHLQDFNITSISDRPVGHNLQDHVSNKGVVFTVNITKTQFDMNWKNVVQYFSEGPKGQIAMHEVPAIYLNSKLKNNSRNWPDLHIQISNNSPANYQNYKLAKEYTQLRKDIWDSVYKPYVRKSTITIIPILNRPKSRGFVRLKKVNGIVEPEIDPKFLSDKSDLDLMVEGLRSAYRLGFSKPFKSLNAKPIKEIFKDCKKFYSKSLAIPSNNYLQCVAKLMTDSLRHPSGTCKMGDVSDKTAVVDYDLNVIGVNRLRVCDSSIMPTIISGFTYGPTIMIAEKCAEIINRYYGQVITQ